MAATHVGVLAGRTMFERDQTVFWTIIAGFVASWAGLAYVALSLGLFTG